MKIETDIFARFTVSLIGRTVILLTMYLRHSKLTLLFLSIMSMCLMSHWPIIFSIRVTLLILTISLIKIKGKIPNYLKACSINGFIFIGRLYFHASSIFWIVYIAESIYVGKVCTFLSMMKWRNTFIFTVNHWFHELIVYFCFYRGAIQRRPS